MTSLKDEGKRNLFFIFYLRFVIDCLADCRMRNRKWKMTNDK